MRSGAIGLRRERLPFVGQRLNARLRQRSDQGEKLRVGICEGLLFGGAMGDRSLHQVGR